MHKASFARGPFYGEKNDCHSIKGNRTTVFHIDSKTRPPCCCFVPFHPSMSPTLLASDNGLPSHRPALHRHHFGELLKSPTIRELWGWCLRATHLKSAYCGHARTESSKERAKISQCEAGWDLLLSVKAEFRLLLPLWENLV